MDANFALAHIQLGQAYLQKQMYEPAIEEFKRSVELSGGCVACVANLARAYAASGKKNDAEKLLTDLKKRSSPSASLASEIAMIYAALGDKDRAMA